MHSHWETNCWTGVCIGTSLTFSPCAFHPTMQITGDTPWTLFSRYRQNLNRVLNYNPPSPPPHFPHGYLQEKRGRKECHKGLHIPQWQKKEPMYTFADTLSIRMPLCGLKKQWPLASGNEQKGIEGGSRTEALKTALLICVPLSPYV